MHPFTRTLGKAFTTSAALLGLAATAQSQSLDDVPSINITRPFGDTTRLDQDFQGTTTGPDAVKVAMDAAGNAVAVFCQKKPGGQRHTMVNRYTASTAQWLPEPIAVSDTTVVESCLSPVVAVDSSGLAMVVWTQFNPLSLQTQPLYSSSLPGSTSWSAPRPVGHETASAVQVAFGGDHVATIVWEAANPSPSFGNHITGAIFNHPRSPNAIWATLTYSNFSESSMAPQVAAAPNGNVIVAWNNFEDGNFHAHARRSVGIDTVLQPDIALDTDTRGSAQDVQIALDRNGNAWAVWSQWDGFRKNIMASRYTVNGSWRTPELVEHNDTNNGEATVPQVAFGPNGDAMVTWQQFNGSATHVWVNRWTAAMDRWEGPRQLDTTTSNAFNPSIGIDGQGNGVVVWTGVTPNSSAHASIYTAGRVWTSGGAWTVDTSIESTGGSVFDSPRLAVHSGGNALAVWTKSRPGAPNNAFASRSPPP